MKLQKLLSQRNACTSSSERCTLTLELALCYCEQSDFSAAIEEYKALLVYLEAGTDRLKTALCYRSLSECFLELSEFNEAIRYASMYLKTTREIHNLLEQQRAFVTVGRCFLCRSENLKNGELGRKSLMAAQQALINSIKCISSLKELSATEAAEMKGVSLLNLGQVLRSLGQTESSRERFEQCINLARKYSLLKILFRSVYQHAELSLFSWPCFGRQILRPSELLTVTDKGYIDNAITLCSKTLRSYPARSCLDKEMKMLRQNLEELLGQLYLAVGDCKRSAKIYKRLSLAYPQTSVTYRSVCRKALKMHGLLTRSQQFISTTAEDLLQVSRLYESLGDIYSSLELHGPALRHYQQMVNWANASFESQRKSVTSSEQLPILSETVKHVDAALVSAAEASRSLGAYFMCAEFYRREIDWILQSPSFSKSASLSASELWQSWLSLGRALLLAPKNTPASLASSFAPTPLPSSKTAEEALCAALAAAKCTDSAEAIRECLEELIEYHKSCGNIPQLHKLSTELRALPEPDDLPSQQSSQRRCSGTPASQQVQEGEENDENEGRESPSSPTAEVIDILSSDSDIEKLIDLSGAPSDVLESPGNRRRGKALCLKTNLKGETPLHVATINGNLEHVVKLVEVLAHPLNVRDGAGWLPIHEAAFHDRTDIANYLLDRGALINDTGCPEDSSPPIFEALHNGSLRTAILLVNRGANLWHVNKADETLSDLINNWKPKKRGPVSVQQQSALMMNLLDAIKQKLGDNYDKWCSYRPSKRASISSRRRSAANSSLAKPPTLSPPSSSSCVAGPARRSFISSESSDEDDEEEGRPSVAVRRGNRKKKKARERPSTSRVDLDSSPKLTEAVQDYQIAMQVIGSSAARFPSEKVDKKQRRKRPSAVPADDDDSWLEDDMGTRRAPGQSRRSKLPRDVSPDEPKGQLPSRGVGASQRPPRETISSLSHRQEQECLEPDVLFDPRELLSSTHMELPALTQLTTSSPVKSAAKPVEVPQPTAPTTNPPALDAKWCTIKVTFPDISLLLPVDTQSRTVAWVAEEALRRRSLLLNDGPDSTTTATARGGRAIARLRTCDGALLLPSDLLFSVLPASALSTGATTELLAEVLEPGTSKKPSTMAPSSQCGSAFQAYSRPYGTEALLPPGPALSRTPSFSHELADFRPKVRKALKEALATGTLNLSRFALGAQNLASALATYARISQHPLVELLLDGNLLSPQDMQPPCLAEQTPFATVFRDLVCRSLGLRTLSLAENFITADSLLSLLSFAATTDNSSQPAGCAPLGQLTRLNLSYNPLLLAAHAPASPSATAPPNSTISPNWLNDFTESEPPNPLPPSSSSPPSLLSQLLRLCPNLSFLGLAGCSLTPDLFLEGGIFGAGLDVPALRQQNLHGVTAAAASTFSHLVELDLSWNPLAAEFSSAEFLFSLLGTASIQQPPHFAGLRCLRLRGCLQAKAKKQTGSPTLFMPNNVAGSWLSCDGDCDYSVQKESAVSGDCLILCLAKLLDSGNFHIQTLDVGHCNLTPGCLLSLQRLLAAPSTSLTSLVCDGNSALRSVSALEGSTWSRILATSAQASSALVNLCIDFPLLKTEEDLAEAVHAVSLKLSASSSPTPLQEFCLKASPPEVFTGRSGKTAIVTCLAASTYSSFSQFPALAGPTLTARFLRSVAQAFGKRFGKLASVTSENCSVTFTVR